MLALCQAEQTVSHTYYKVQLAMPGLRKTLVRERFFLSNPVKKRIRKKVRLSYHRKHLS